MTKQFIKNLVKSMTIEEKLAQMTQLYPNFFRNQDSIDLTGPMEKLNLKPEWINKIGSILNAYGAKKLIEIQNKNLRENPHKIPLLFMADIIHGYKAFFPIPLAMGCSFNPDVFEKAAEIAARESAVSGIHLTFSPMADLVRDPRWGRVMESPGEDPYLNSIMTAATVRGYQGDDFKQPGRIAACVKHFAGYGAPEGGREYNTVDISHGILRDFYLPAYKAALDVGVAMVMTSFNIIDRIPASANKLLFRNILREEWGFNGVVISDFAAVHETIEHGLSEDGLQAAQKCIEASVDIEMMSCDYLNYGKKLIEDGKISESMIDEAVIRILELKDALGLFENPYKDADPQKEKEILLCKKHRKVALEVALESVVLLKNEGILPLKKGLKIGLVGPFVKSRDVLGGWSNTRSTEIEAVSLYEGLTAKISEEFIKTAMTDELGSIQKGIFDVKDNLEQACNELKDCDVIIAAVGENPSDTGEGASKTNLRLSPNQEKLIMELKRLGKPIIMIVFSGRPLEIKPVLNYTDAVIQAWFLGTESGNALAEILCGDFNPTGRLSMSFPQTVGQIPVYYNHYNTGRPVNNKRERFLSRYIDCPNDPLFCFGYGLSYSNFIYNDFKIKKENDDMIIASISVENCSQIAGKETIQLYIRDVSASVIRPVKELKGFKQLWLEPNEKKTVFFTITKEMLKFWNDKLEYVFEPGYFDIMIGKNSCDVFSERVYIK